MLRQAIYHILLSNTGGTWAGNHRCSLPFVLTLQHNSTLSTDKTSRKCVLFLQSTPPQNWIHLSVYHNRSGSYQDHCSADVIHEYYSDYISYISLLTLNLGYERQFNYTNNLLTYKRMKLKYW